MTLRVQSPSLLLLGGPKTGKTHYGGQLLRRLQHQQWRLRMIGVPTDLSGFQEVCNALSQGKSAPHTPVNVYRESIWHLGLAPNGPETELVWPDYGGEQVERLISQRQVPDEWVERVRHADGWLLFIRLGLLPNLDDMLTRPRTLSYMQRPTEAFVDGSLLSVPPTDSNRVATDPAKISDNPAISSPLSISPQAHFIELLQALLFVKQAETARRVTQPPLFLILSCWDELFPNSEESSLGRPAEVLKSRLPLLSRFVEANWEPNAFEVMGLSAQGKPLDNNVPDEDFIDNGPERQGFCVLPDGTRSSDLTLPVAGLLEKVLL